MRSTLKHLFRSEEGAAAAELALVTPLLTVLMFGSMELGNYFLAEHTLTKAVRDGARFAARNSFTYFPTCGAAPSSTSVAALGGIDVGTATRNVIRTGQVSGGTDRLPLWPTNGTVEGTSYPSAIKLDVQCATTAGGQTMSGIYTGIANGAPKIVVTTRIPYRSIVGLIGLGATSLTLNATAQAAVVGI